MKSVIAQGSSIAKAIEEALKKAGQPAEFFVKLLEDAQGGFLGFGAKKAKIALFFTQNSSNHKKEGLLSQDTYQDLFDNKALHQQIENQLKHINTSKPQSSEPKAQQPKQQQGQRHQQAPRPMQQRPQPKQPTSPNASKQSQPKNEQKHPQQPQRPHKNFEQKKSESQKQNNQSQAPKEKTNASKLMVRPLPNKNNDSSKS